MKNFIGIILLALSLGLFYVGATTIQDSGESVEIVGLELSVADEDEKKMGYTYMGIGVLCLIGGVTIIRNKK